MKIKPRYYQEESANEFVRFLSEGNPLVVLPTGAGKTIVISMIVDMLIDSGRQIIVLSHVKEILEQDHKKIEEYTGIKAGLYSSMLESRTIEQVTVAGIQSIYKKPYLIDNNPLVIVDEAHTINTEQNTMYSRFFKNIGTHRRGGLTATPYRTGTGFIYGPNQPFDKVVSDWGTGEKFMQLVNDGYLCNLTTKRTKQEMDTSDIRVVAGDYSEKDLSNKFDREAITSAIIKEIIAAGKNRNKWLIFAIDVNHAEHIAEILIRSGIPTAPVHSKMERSGFDRNKTVDRYRNNKYRCAVTVNVLSTGYDDPEIDLIANLRPTKSPVFHVQSNGRGSRPFDGKKDCLILDFAGNTARLGPINDPIIYIKGKGKGTGEPITKTCPLCDTIVAASVRLCPECSYEFPIQHKLERSASADLIIDDGKPHWLDVDDIEYKIHRSPISPSCIVVIYKCNGYNIRDWIHIEHRGFAKHKADHWVQFRGGKKCKTVNDFMRQKDIFKKPTKILAQKKGAYYTISDAKF